MECVVNKFIELYNSILNESIESETTSVGRWLYEMIRRAKKAPIKANSLKDVVDELYFKYSNGELPKFKSLAEIEFEMYKKHKEKEDEFKWRIAYYYMKNFGYKTFPFIQEYINNYVNDIDNINVVEIVQCYSNNREPFRTYILKTGDDYDSKMTDISYYTNRVYGTPLSKIIDIELIQNNKIIVYMW